MENKDQTINQTPPAPPVVQAPPVSSPINQPTGGLKRPIIIAVVVGLVILVANVAFGIYLYEKSRTKTVEKPVAQKQSPSPTPDPTASWKTYTNPLIDFTFKYPQDLEATSSQVDINNLSITINSPTTASDQTHTILSVTKNIQNLTLANYLQNTYGQPTHPGGNPAIMVEGIFKSFQEINIPLKNSYSYIGNFDGGQSKVLFFSYKNNFYTFALYGGTGAGAGYSQSAENIYNTMVSTFKFTDQAVTPLSIQDVAQIKQLLATLDNTTADKIVFTQDQQKYSNFASGGFGQTGVAGGAKWFAAKINNQWKIIFTGNGAIPNCSDITQYNPPKDFLPCN